METENTQRDMHKAAEDWSSKPCNGQILVLISETGTRA